MDTLKMQCKLADGTVSSLLTAPPVQTADSSNTTTQTNETTTQTSTQSADSDPSPEDLKGATSSSSDSVFDPQPDPQRGSEVREFVSSSIVHDLCAPQL